MSLKNLPDTILNAITAAAIQHDIPAALLRAIVHIESSGNPFALRYEPAFLATYIDKDVPCYGASLQTERIARATSWGLMQVMGQVARELGCTDPFLSVLCHPATGIEYGCKQLARLKKRHYAAHGWPGVIAAYNAGSPRINGAAYVNQAYVDKVTAVWAIEKERAQ